MSIKDMMKQADRPAQGAGLRGVMAAGGETAAAGEIPLPAAAIAESAPNLTATLASAIPSFDADRMEIHFEVKNSAQKEWIDRNRRIKMEESLRHALGSNSVRLFVDVAEIRESDTAAKLYMPSDRDDYLTRNSEEFRNLKNDFGLEVN